MLVKAMHVDAPSLHIALVEPEIHWNAGNAGRTCLATGAQLHLVEPLGFSLDDREVQRAGLDYWPRVRPRVWPNWDAFEAGLASLGPAFYFSAEADADFWDARFEGPVVLVFGRESVGLPGSIRERHRDRLFRVPMRAGSVRSLNVSTCVGIAAYEVLRQRRAIDKGLTPPTAAGR